MIIWAYFVSIREEERTYGMKTAEFIGSTLSFRTVKKIGRATVGET